MLPHETITSVINHSTCINNKVEELLKEKTRVIALYGSLLQKEKIISFSKLKDLQTKLKNLIKASVTKILQIISGQLLSLSTALNCILSRISLNVIKILVFHHFFHDGKFVVGFQG